MKNKKPLIAKYVLSNDCRTMLSTLYPPLYKWFGTHITEEFDVESNFILLQPRRVNIVGYLHQPSVLQSFLVEINGNHIRLNGTGQYHVTWSLDPTLVMPKYSNAALQNLPIQPLSPISLETVAVVE